MNIIRTLPNFEPKAIFELERTHLLHLNREGKTQLAQPTAELGTFGNMVFDALGQTNEQILESQLLQQQAIVSPDSVDPSTIVVSLLKADMKLSLTKAVIERATAAYRELTTVR